MEHATYTIENNALIVSISDAGAELQSVICKGVERMWCGDAAVWPRRAPLLFPLIGRMRDGSYDLNGTPRKAPRHGFCRDRLFAAEQTSPTSALFTTASDDDTRVVFPFDFTLEVEFSISGNTLTKLHHITNTGSSPMPFELGGHEAYAICVLPGERASNYYVHLGQRLSPGTCDKDGSSPSESLDRTEAFQMDAEGILQLPKVTIPLQNGSLRQTPEQLGLDTIVLENVPASTATLACDVNPYAVTVEFPDFPYLGIWTKPVGCGNDARYLCIEPWSALPDAHFAPRELAKKPGVRTLAPGEAATLAYRMTFE